MLKKVTDVINKFDPLDLLPYAPSDEYKKEIYEINSFLENKMNHDVIILAHQIYDIFERTLGDDVFDKSINDCYNVAREILNENN